MVLLDAREPRYRFVLEARDTDPEDSNAPPGAIAFLISALFVKIESELDEDRLLPWGGSVYPWSSSKVIGLLVGFGVLLLALSALQWKLGKYATVPIFAVITTGIIVDKLGYYVSFMILGQLNQDMQWAAYLVLTGIGLGMGQQLPYTAIQMVLNEKDVLVGNALVTLAGQLGGAIAFTVGESIFINRLLDEVPKNIIALSPEQIITAGASNLSSLASSSATLSALRAPYVIAFSSTTYFSLALNVKKEAANQQSDRLASQSTQALSEQKAKSHQDTMEKSSYTLEIKQSEEKVTASDA
ncbi:hypothetical protein MMC25_001005 [Agyrium rufum]|nr:hypothetical protein [Agyrium rufum]